MSGMLQFYRDITHHTADPRTADWFLVSSPVPVLIIMALYVYISVSAGPRYMRDKKPLDLRNVLILYNFAQVLASVYIVYEGLAGGWWGEYNFTCQGIDRSSNPRALRMASAVYAYYVCKLIELLDTVFFILRKKNQQITFLHVYHHALMPLCGWIGVRYYPGGHGTMTGLINSFIHIFMYTYYMLASVGPEIQKFLWWKKYLTLMQIIQFCIILAHTSQLFVNGCSKFPTFLAFLLSINAILFIYLFSSFYVRTYLRMARTKKRAAVDGPSQTTAPVNSDFRKKAD